MQLNDELMKIAQSDQGEECFRTLARNVVVYQQELIKGGCTPQLADQLCLQANHIYLQCFFVRAFTPSVLLGPMEVD